MTKGLFILDTGAYEKIYSSREQEAISRLVDIYAPPQTKESIKANPSVLNDVEVIFSGWAGPVMDEDFLAAAPNLKAVFYGAGSIKGIVTDAFWDRDIPITSAFAANAVPVAEYTLSQILFCLKCGWRYERQVRQQGKFPSRFLVPGAYGTTVGIVSLGMIGRIVCEHLRMFDIEVLAYDPYVSEGIASELDIELCSLDDIFRRSDVVSLHTPRLKETLGMITGEHFSSMKSDASFINTARGAVVRETEMIEVLQNRPDLTAILDVTWPEPPEAGSPLYTLDNVVLTPHIAGSMDRECERMGDYMVQELNRWLSGEPLKWVINRKQAAVMA